MDPETVYSYLHKLENAFILHRCSRYDIQGKEILKTQEKFYLADTSFRFSVLGYDENAVAGMLENVVYMELLRRGYDVFVGKLSRWEVDFVATRREEKIYIQISERIGTAETEKIPFLPSFLYKSDLFPGNLLCYKKVLFKYKLK